MTTHFADVSTDETEVLDHDAYQEWSQRVDEFGETAEERAAYEAWLEDCEDVLGDTHIGRSVQAMRVGDFAGF